MYSTGYRVGKYYDMYSTGYRVGRYYDSSGRYT